MGPGYNELSEEEKSLVRWAIERKSVVVKDITYYVYCRNVASWSQMESFTASQELSDVMGINAPVNFATALGKYYPLLIRVAFPFATINTSVYVGTYRLEYKVTYADGGPIVVYKPHETVIENLRGDEHRRMYVFVTSPIAMPFPFECPVRTLPDFEGEI